MSRGPAWRPDRIETSGGSPLFALAERSEPTWVVSATWFFVGLGIAVRLVRYFVNYPIWHDEAFLAVNFWDRGYLDLLRPLDYGQVAPWLFLAIERTAVTWLGYSEPALRLFSTICSVLSLPLLPPRRRPVSARDAATSGSRGPRRFVLPDPPRCRDQAVRLGSTCLADPAGPCRRMDAITGIQPVVVGTDGIGTDPGCPFLSRRIRGGGCQPGAGAFGFEVKSTAGSSWMHCLQPRPGRLVPGRLLRLYGVSGGGHARQLPQWVLGRRLSSARSTLGGASLARGRPRRHDDVLPGRRSTWRQLFDPALRARGLPGAVSKPPENDTRRSGRPLRPGLDRGLSGTLSLRRAPLGSCSTRHPRSVCLWGWD